MARSLPNFLALLGLVCLLFLLFSANEMEMVEAKVCQRRSKTWSGWCGETSHCDNQCKKWEDARHGACHRDGIGMACFCYFNC